MNLLSLKSSVSFPPIRLGTLAGVPLRFAWSWFVIFALHSWALAALYLPSEARGYSEFGYWIAATISTLLLFASVLIHELGHAFMARFEGLGIEHITLHIFGGMTKLESEVATPAADLKIAVVGPAASFVIGFLFLLASQVAGALHGQGLAVHSLRYLGIINLVLAAFNLLPGFPLDGGRVLRAFLWWRRGDATSATRLTVRAGKRIALVLIFTGIAYAVSTREYLVGLWTVLVGIFLRDAAWSVSEQLLPGAQTIEHIPELVEKGREVSPDFSIERFIDEVVAVERETSYLVSLDRKLLGVVSLSRMRAIAAEKWGELLVRDVMDPVDSSLFVTMSSTLEDAREVLSSNGLGFAAVIDEEGCLLGSIRLERMKALLEGREN